MVDTIVLLLTKDMFIVTDPDKFQPSASWIQSPSALKSRLIQSKQNPTKKELRTGIYKPRLTLSQRMNHLGQYSIVLKIEVSLPKLFFGNNFEELQFKDFVPVARKLVTALESMGISTTLEYLSKAPVSSIHYSKNFHFTDGSTPYHYISKIKEAGMKLSLDINQTDYRNEGHSYKWHCNAY